MRYGLRVPLIWSDWATTGLLILPLESAVTNLYIKILNTVEKKLNKIKKTTTTTTTTSKLWYTSPNLVELKFIWLLKDTWYFHLSNDWMKQTVLHTLRKLSKLNWYKKRALIGQKTIVYLPVYPLKTKSSSFPIEWRLKGRTHGF